MRLTYICVSVVGLAVYVLADCTSNSCGPHGRCINERFCRCEGLWFGESCEHNYGENITLEVEPNPVTICQHGAPVKVIIKCSEKTSIPHTPMFTIAYFGEVKHVDGEYDVPCNMCGVEFQSEGITNHTDQAVRCMVRNPGKGHKYLQVTFECPPRFPPTLSINGHNVTNGGEVTLPRGGTYSARCSVYGGRPAVNLTLTCPGHRDTWANTDVMTASPVRVTRGLHRQRCVCTGRHKTGCYTHNTAAVTLIFPECQDGKFGLNCTKDCHCSQACDKDTGFCRSFCLPGWREADCQQECENYTFGLNCAKTCHCNKRSEICDKIDGGCTSGCLPGWRGSDCHQECENYTFGLNCAKTCHCNNRSEICDKIDGVCTSGCLPGWRGSDCHQECPTGKFGLNCARDCRCSTASDCDKVSGRCLSGCLPGWKHPDCQQQDCSHNGYCGIHTCHELRHDYNCSCLDGYNNSDYHNCEDIDECQHEYICDIHTCRNANGSFYCICNSNSYANIDHQLCLLIVSVVNERLDFLFLAGDIKVLVVEVGLSLKIILFIVVTLLLCAKTVVRSVYRFVTTEPAYMRQIYRCPFNSLASVEGILESECNSDDAATDDHGFKIDNSLKRICSSGNVSHASRTSRASQDTGGTYKSCLECEGVTSVGCKRCGAQIQPSGSMEGAPGFGSCGICGRVVHPSE